MTLVRRNPGTYFSSVDNLISQLFNNDWFDWSTRNFSTTNTTLPAVNIMSDDNKFMVEVAAPGMKKEDFRVELNNNQLSISSEKEMDNSRNGDDYTRREFSYQSFMRSFTLPDIVDSEKITAHYEDGILYLEIPKKEEAKPKPARMIEIV